ncbi:YbhB/YbcL family Raf kinase inhibitor-like protein [Brevundimonas sp.]|uniref:YbhB/YbcL family Raf kinase inhibitor-like protein n=1 Tax=Brevundimonas sp. TaxID=1871086 RepID=UPI00120E5351|nr:YbhB/YbcL family Raf kinase inhibitor-like protein [Brevundimonas sp.]TAJ66994.1 MAG: YbhB/YbcL family Raf kinase inhibitor-like protein [Brevundimonas sp.]
MTFTVTSTGFADGGVLPDAQVHAGGNRSPQLSWSGAPEGAKSFAVTCYDPDAPTGSGFWHWTVANIPADVTELAEGASPAGLPDGAVEGRTDFGEPGFGGAAPPKGHGPHRYIFTVFAVDTDRLDVTPENSGAVFGFNLHFHTLAKASITGVYEARSPD